MAPQHPTAGFYGKLVSAGDFVRRGFPIEIYERWDHWLQQGLIYSRAALGEHWLDAYLSAPIWRFALAPGLAGESAWVGAMMPSVDRVGRYFPLTVITQTSSETPLFIAAGRAQPWLNAIEQVLLETLEGEGLSGDALADRISTTTDQVGISTKDTPSSTLLEKSDHCITLQTEGHIEIDTISHHLANALTAQLLGEPLSLWWSTGSNLVATGARLYHGLPVEADFCRLLTDAPLPTGSQRHAPSETGH